MKTTGNYLKQPQRNFPLDAEGLEAIQNNMMALELLGMLAGDKSIIAGCELSENGTYREKGWCWIKTVKCPMGELLPWEGGYVNAGIYIKSKAVEVDAEGYNYPQAYTERVLAPGVSSDGEQYEWNDFHEAESTEVLRGVINAQAEAIAKIKGVPAGVIEMWSGSEAPEGYLLCDGRKVKKSEYPELFEAIGDSYSTASLWNGVANEPPGEGYFNIPDLRGRFVVGNNAQDGDYSAKGKSGGLKMVTLKVAQMPSHKHGIKFTDFAWGDDANSRPFPSTTGTSGYAASTEEVGGGEGHENRPPYYALGYIIKAK